MEDWKSQLTPCPAASASRSAEEARLDEAGVVHCETACEDGSQLASTCNITAIAKSSTLVNSGVI